MKKYLIGLSLGLCSLFANAQYINSGELVKKHYEHEYGRSFAIGYILGVIDAYDGYLFCVPEKATSGDLRDLIIQGLQQNPQVHQQAASELIFQGFSAAFPCQDKKTNNKSIL